MEYATAIGVVSGILSFVTFGTKLVQGAIKIHEADGALEENRTLQEVTEDLRVLSLGLIPPDDPTLSRNDKALCLLAKKCGSLADDLLRLLEDVKPKDGSKRQSLRAALKNMTKKGEIEGLEKRLGTYRDELGVHLQFVTSRQTGASLQHLINLVQSDSGKFDDLTDSIRQLKQGVEVCGLSEQAESQVKSLLALPEKILNSVAADRILRGLDFDGMRGRQDAVHDAHAETFQWLMSGGISVRDRMRQQAHELFNTWLHSESGIFHISGKLGSGKSTLMKYLGEHAEERLGAWAGARKLVFGRFFFWRPGTQLQKSLPGLYRTLLYDILKICPEFIPMVLPNHWKKARSMPLQVHSHLEIDKRELVPALERLLSGEIQEIFERHCFCFFIDGLDEYEDTTQGDHQDLADLLNTWAKAGLSSNAIKLCVSSRPYNAFMNAFSPERRLHLHKLTYLDMDVYVRDKLQDINSLRGFNELVRKILEKADGVFQWVAIAVKHMRAEIQNKKSGIKEGLVGVEEFRSSLKMLPQEINDLYRHILSELVPDTARAYRTLAMVAKATELDLEDFSVDAYSFFDKYESDNGYIMSNSFPLDAGADTAPRSTRSEYGKNLLRWWCGGLVETRPSYRYPFEVLQYTPFEVLKFTHRSIPDFLECEGSRQQMLKYLGGFNTLDAISQMLLADLRMLRGECLLVKTEGKAICRLLEERDRANMDNPPYTFLEALDKDTIWWSETPWGIKVQGAPGSLGSLGEAPDPGSPEGRAFQISLDKNESNTLASEGSSSTKRYEMVWLNRPLVWSILAGSPRYLLWKMKEDGNLTDNFDKKALFAYLIFQQQKLNSTRNFEADLAVLEFLLDKGLFDGRTSLQPFRCSWKQRNVIGNGTPRLTVWQHFLRYEWMYQHGYAPDDETNVTPGELNTRFAKIAGWFLQHGADSSFTAIIEIPQGDDQPFLKSRKEDPVWWRSNTRLVSFRFQDSTGSGKNAGICKDYLVNYNLDRRRTRHVSSLKGWVQDLKADTETKDELLRLIEQQSTNTIVATSDSNSDLEPLSEVDMETNGLLPKPIKKPSTSTIVATPDSNSSHRTFLKLPIPYRGIIPQVFILFVIIVSAVYLKKYPPYW